MNDMLLNSIGGGVWNPPTRDQVIKSSFPSEQIHAFLSNQVKPVWGLKDPRTLLTFEIWKPYFKEIADITYVFVHRPFESSVCSLDYREKK
ncbi:hypothetical protein V7138_25210 [Bacillus sp. JJ1533]|uniref:hypothetical protein n=1 Tax=Bacillus sp. JJ1533 TaxID=3122959 RepID=UPI002FFFB424